MKGIFQGGIYMFEMYKGYKILVDSNNWIFFKVMKERVTLEKGFLTKESARNYIDNLIK